MDKIGKTDRSKVSWCPPQEGWVKVNFDGATCGNPRPFGAGVIKSNWKGDLLATTVKNLTAGSNNQATLVLVYLCKAMNMDKVHVEGDSKNSMGFETGLETKEVRRVIIALFEEDMLVGLIQLCNGLSQG